MQQMFAPRLLSELAEPATLATLFTGPVEPLEILAAVEDSELAFEGEAVTEITVRGTRVAIPVFETLLFDETTSQQSGGRAESRMRRSRAGRLVWIDVLAALRLTVEGTPLVGRVEALREESLLERLGDQADMAALETALGAIVPPAEAASTIDRLGIGSIADYRSGRHRILDVQATPAPSEPLTEIVEVDLCILVFDGVDFRDQLRTAALTRSVLERETALQPGTAQRRAAAGAAYLAVLSAAAIANDPLPGRSAAESEAAVRALFRSVGFLTHFAPEPGP